MRHLTAALLLAGLMHVAAPEPASAQIYARPGWGDPTVGRYWNQSTFTGPGVYHLPSYGYRVPGSVTFGYSYYGAYPTYGVPGYGYYGSPYGYGYGARPGYTRYDVYRSSRPYRNGDYGTYWGWTFD